MVQCAMMRGHPLPLDPRRVTLLAMLTICGCSGCKPSEEPAAPVVSQDRRTGLVFDASGSMAAKLDGTPKIEVARVAVDNLLGNMNPADPLALVAYGHRRKGDCEDIEVLAPVGSPHATTRDGVAELTPTGQTPLTDAITQMATHLESATTPAHIVLLTDGEETCHPDPCAAIRELKSRSTELVVDVIAFDMSPEATASLACLATETGGTVTSVDDAPGLAMALDDAVFPQREPPPDDFPPATLKAPDTAPAGTTVSVAWTGRGYERDFIVVVKAGAEEGTWAPGRYAYVNEGSPVSIQTPSEPGDYELRYVAANGKKTLGRRAITLTGIAATVKAPTSAPAGSDVAISWTGPAYNRDFLTIVKVGSPDNTWDKYAYVEEGSPLTIQAPNQPGDYEIRYVIRNGRKTLARQTLTLTGIEATVKASASAPAGSDVAISWTGPAYNRDFLTIVKVGSPDNTWDKYTYVEEGSPLTIQAPNKPGDYEIRYVIRNGRKTLARQRLTLTDIAATVKAPSSAPAGSDVPITWTGPAYNRDFLTIVKVGTPDDKRDKYTYVEEGSPLTVQAPGEPGDYEIRYVMMNGRRVLARKKLKITRAP